MAKSGRKKTTNPKLLDLYLNFVKYFYFFLLLKHLFLMSRTLQSIHFKHPKPMIYALLFLDELCIVATCDYILNFRIFL